MHHAEPLGDHGLTLIVAPRMALPLVSVALLLRCGPAFDVSGRRGAAELMAQLLTRGAVRRGRVVEGGRLARQAEALGSAVSVRVEERLTVLEMTVLAPRAAAALALLADLLRHPLFAPEDLGAVRAQAHDALSLRMQDPAQLAMLVARRTAWGLDPQGRVTTPASLKAVRREDVVALHRRWVRPDRVAIVLAGQVDLAAARVMAGSVLGDWLRPPETLPEDPPEPSPFSRPSEAVGASCLLIDLPTTAQTSVLVCAPFVGTDAPDHAAGTLAAAVVGAGHSARLNQEVRVRRGLSYGVAGRVETQRRTGLFFASTQTDHGHAAEIATLMQAQLLAMAQQPVGNAELAARRAALLGGLARQRDTTSGLVARIGEDWMHGRSSADSRHRWAEPLESVSPRQVQAFAQRHWHADRLRTVIAGPIDRVLSATAALPDALRLAASVLDLDRPGLRR
jgi:zinc protease